MHSLVGTLILIAVSTFYISAYSQQSESLPSSGVKPQRSTEGKADYPDVAAALKALKARTDVQISVQGGWTLITEPTTHTQWSFTPSNHPAYPAVVKRTVIKKDGDVDIRMEVICQANKTACDKLVSEFQGLNDKLRESLRRNDQPGAAADPPISGGAGRLDRWVSISPAALDDLFPIADFSGCLRRPLGYNRA